MAEKLKAEELRAELSERGLSTTGPKHTLFQRLKSHLNEEKVVSVDGTDASVGRKRQRECKADDWNVSKKIRTVEDLQQVVPVSTDWGKNLKNSSEGKENLEEEEAKENKQVKTNSKRTAVLDQYVPHHIKAEYHVLEHEEEMYDAMLNQTNIVDNINEFYVIQALESHDGSKFMVYNRWGRVGIKGEDKLQGPYTSREQAIHQFREKFFAKTRNHWQNRKEFTRYPKFYTWLELDYNTDKESDTQEKPSTLAVDNQVQLSKLDPRIAKFISLICNSDMMKQQMMDLGYNVKKLPLGKLSRSMILKGYDVLRKIADVIDQSDNEKLEQLSGEFYTIIPHDFGSLELSGFTIDNPYKLKCKLEMVQALGEIEVETSFIKDIYAEGDTLFSWYQCLCCDLKPLEADSKEFSMIKKYIQNTGTETSFKVDIIQIFNASRKGENERFEKFSSTKNRLLLWHGSRLTNWAGILSQGLRIAPPEAPVEGHSFGKGVYFADMFSESVLYCKANNSSQDAVLLLCEVALGEMNELLYCDDHADKLPEGKLSTKGVGSFAPDLSEAQVLEDGVIVPLGVPKDQPQPKASKRHNEYVVYNVHQIRMRYVVHVNLQYNSG